jgi:hypothetical protein
MRANVARARQQFPKPLAAFDNPLAVLLQG